MSTRTGTTLTCDHRHDCPATAFGATEEKARAAAYEWTRHPDGRDFCRECSAIRAKRKPLREMVTEGTALYTAFDAAAAVGWERRNGDETGVAHFYCCGKHVEVASMIGNAYGAHCQTCGASIASVLGPAFGNSWVSFPDGDKVDVEDPACWVATPGKREEKAIVKDEENRHAHEIR